MQAFVKGGTLKKIRLTAVEWRRLSEARDILDTISRFSSEAVSPGFVELYGTLCTKLKERFDGKDDNQMEFPDEVYASSTSES